MKEGRDRTLNAKRWKEAEQAFEAVVGLPPVEREEALDRICSSKNSTIRSLVMELLEADDKAGDFLEEPLPGDKREQVFQAFAGPLGGKEIGRPEAADGQVLGSDANPEPGGVQDLTPGDLIDDRYRLEEILGEGGMGTVYRATQVAPIERGVAIKVVKLGMDTRRVIARFEIERQALALMNHPNIAYIFDAGATGRGRPYFVMELVSGAPITSYCEEKGLDVDARLRLFLDVCAAVQHAHQKGIIHRDLKPGNVLVTEQDGEPVVKVIDFGIAKATGGSAAEHTLATEGTMILGTPAYMSPEQIDGGAKVDTRTDVYALGLVLYELLTGSPAFDEPGFQRGDVAKVLRAIVEVDPDRPSTRVGRLEKRGVSERPTLRRRLRGDLDWIVMKALAKEPELRYETARAFALDIRRHFDNQPVSAGPPSTAYVLGKFARRRKRLLAVVSAFVLLGFVALVAMYLKSQEALAARDEAAAQLRISSIERGRLLGQTGDIGAAEELIWREYLRAPDSLHAYWTLWETFMQSRCVATVAGHTGRVSEIELDGSGAVLASAGNDGRVVIRDASSLRMSAVLEGSGGRVEALAVSNDGRCVATGDATGVVVIWEVATRTPLQRWQASDRTVLALDFAPDGRRLVSGGIDGVVRLWDPDAGTLIAELDESAGKVQGLRFNPDGSLVAAAHVGMITLWDGVASSPQRVFPAYREAFAVTFSSDGSLLAGGGQEQRIDVWELSSGSRRASFEGVNSTVRALVFGPDNRTLYSGCWYSIDRWDLVAGERLWRVPTSNSVWGVVIDPRGRLLTAATAEGELRRWEVDRGAGIYRLTDGVASRGAVFSADGRSVLVGDDLGRIRLADFASGDILATIAGHEDGIRSIAVSGYGKLAASASDDGTIRVWNAGSGDLIFKVDDGMIQTSRAIDLDDAGRFLAYAAIDGRSKVVSIPDGREIEMITPSGAESLSVALSPDGMSLATIARDHHLRFWTLEGESLGALNLKVGNGGLWTAAYSPDGATIALGMWDRAIRIVSVADRTVDAVLEGHGGTVWAVAFKPDDPRILASAAADGTVRLWDVPNQLNVATIQVAPGRDVHAVSFTPDGATLLAAGEFDGPYCYDLTHFDRHIAGNLEYQIERLGDELGDERVNELRAWAAGVMKRPWPRFR